MKLSVVTTIYGSANVIQDLFDRSLQAADAMGAELELVLVNDASPDNGLAVARELQAREPRVKLIDLARNVGQHRALWFGLRHATGDLVAIMDGDLDEDPLWLIEARDRMIESDCDVVYGIQATRRRSPFYRLSRRLFYGALSAMTSADFPRNVTTFRLMTRRFVEALRQFEEREIFLVGILHMAGFKQVPMEVMKRADSPSSYSLSKLAMVFVTHTTSFSIAPLIFVFVAGVFLLAISVLAVFALIVFSMTTEIKVPGWASTTAILTMFSGLLLSFNGILAIYIGTIFLEVKRRPLAIVRDVYITDSAVESDAGPVTGAPR